MLVQIYNGPMPTTAGQAAVTTGTAIKTLLQVKLGTQSRAKVVEWGISFDGSAAATPILCELCETGTVFGTVTAAVLADILKLDPGGVAPNVSALVLGTSATGYTCTAEGSIVAVRMLDAQFVAPTNQYIKQYPQGREPIVEIGSALRIRVTAAAAVNALCYVTLDI